MASEAGFFQQKRNSPAGFALVVALHAAALAAVMLIKGPQIIPPRFLPTAVTFITAPQTPPEYPRELPKSPIPPRHVSTIDQTTRTTETQQASTGEAQPPQPFPPLGDPGQETVITRPADPPSHVPVRRDAEIDPRFAANFRPPYPPSEQRAEREGIVRLRVTIGVDGRVVSVERISATSDAFWASAERQALTRWRFRPATEDGRPVQSVKVLTLRFELQDA